MRLSYEDLKCFAAKRGLEVLGVTSSDPLPEDAERLRVWQEGGMAAGMHYMQRDPTLLSNPGAVFPGCCTVITFSVRYESAPHPPLQPGHGRVARYAWGRDYHLVLSDALAALTKDLQDHLGSTVHIKCFTDAVPLLERAFAARAQLGFIGKNTLLIRPGVGSYTFIAEILTDIEIDGVPAIPTKGRCGPCTRCSRSCPTHALDAEYHLDARRCISYLTIEKRGAFTLSERTMLGEWIFGCDVCQDVCPFNFVALKCSAAPQFSQFKSSEGVGPLLSMVKVLSLRTNRLFEEAFRGTPLLRARRVGLLRNAAVVAANTRALEMVQVLIDATQTDPSAIVRQHCAWALRVLHPGTSGAERSQVQVALDALTRDPSAEVVAEVVS